MKTLYIGPPHAPIVTLTQSRLNSSSLLISWSMSDCVVQYVVTINSSDDTIYPNITTSDTNIKVTLTNGVEYCVTVVAVDGIGRRGPDSIPLCGKLAYSRIALVYVLQSISDTPIFPQHLSLGYLLLQINQPPLLCIQISLVQVHAVTF